MKALVTGATGFLGRRLVARLDRPVVFSRSAARAAGKLAPAGIQVFEWDPMKGPPPLQAFEGVDAVFHLAGDSVADGRWTARKKARIRDSRVVGTRNLVAGLRASATRPKVLISASAVGYYGSRGDEELTEQSRPGSDFLAEVCVEWEREAAAARELGLRVVPIRIGVVLGARGGALAKMLLPFQLGLGSPLGSGRQYMSWIHIDDLVELMLFAAAHPALDEPVNGVAPLAVTNREFTKTLGKVLKRPTFMPAVPGLAMKLLVGEFAEVLLASQRVVPRVALEAGFAYRFVELQPALNDALQPSPTAGAV
jgi:uncharacterized protein (TIGR01777 family)